MKKSVVIIFLFSASVVLFGCTASMEASDNYYPRDQTFTDDAGGAPQGAKCAVHNSTQQCICRTDEGEVYGRQVCYTGTGWTQCECANADDSLTTDPYGTDDLQANKILADFNWQDTIPEGGSCKSGRYDGWFDGIYIPAITFGFGPIPVFGNLSFELERTSNGEFFQVENGHMVGSALVAFAFEGDIRGSLDCGSRVFEGQLKNCYYIIPGLPPFAFEGVIKAEYDKFNNTFVNGVWSVTEIDITGNFPPPLPVTPGVPVPLPPPLGGTGTWTNTFAY